MKEDDEVLENFDNNQENERFSDKIDLKINDNNNDY